jgi:biotin operon repressor
MSNGTSNMRRLGPAIPIASAQVVGDGVLLADSNRSTKHAAGRFSKSRSECMEARSKRTRRDEIAAFIAAYSQQHGQQSPSLQDIADAFKISKTAADDHVQKLIAEGRAVRQDGKLWLTQPPLFILPEP